jgi:hypothetical protein
MSQARDSIGAISAIQLVGSQSSFAELVKEIAAYFPLAARRLLLKNMLNIADDSTLPDCLMNFGRCKVEAYTCSAGTKVFSIGTFILFLYLLYFILLRYYYLLLSLVLLCLFPQVSSIFFSIIRMAHFQFTLTS